MNTHVNRILKEARATDADHWSSATIFGGGPDGRCHGTYKLGPLFTGSRAVRCDKRATDDAGLFCGHHDHLIPTICAMCGDDEAVREYLLSKGYVEAET